MTRRRPLVLVGYMAAGKTTIGRLVARRLGASFADTDQEISAETGVSIPELFARHGEEEFRRRESTIIQRLLAEPLGVIAIGGGALREPVISLLRQRAHVVWLDIEPDRAFARLRRQPASRPLATSEEAFRALAVERHGVYAAAADAYVDADHEPSLVAEMVISAALIRPAALDRLGEEVDERRSLLVCDRIVAHHADAPIDARLELDGGEQSKTITALDSVWHAMADAGLERRDCLVALGGGSITDVAGFAAATFRRGLEWIACPTSLVGQVDAAIGGKTAINVAAKNDVGAFHQPQVVLADTVMLESLPHAEWAAGFAEVIKTALLAGGRLYDSVRQWPPGPGSAEERTMLVRRTAAYKTRIVCIDPHDQGLRSVLNLGHTIGHGIEAAAGYQRYRHGEAVAVGLRAALWISERVCGLDPDVRAQTEDMLARHGLPLQARVSAEQVAAAVRGDKKRARGRPLMVLLDAVGAPRTGVDPGDDLLASAIHEVTTSAV